MNLLKHLKNMEPEAKRLLAIRTIAWGMPIILIPSLRFYQDKDKNPKDRNELFFRDFSAYAAGTGMYFAGLYSSIKILKHHLFDKVSKNKKMIIPELVASSSFCLWSGVVAPKLSKAISGRKTINTEGTRVLEEPTPRRAYKSKINFSHNPFLNSSNTYFKNFNTSTNRMKI